MRDFFITLNFDPASQTVFVFTLVLFSMIFFPSFYLALSPKKLYKIEQRSIFCDWRIIFPLLVYSVFLGFRYNYSFDWEQYMNTFEFMKLGIVYREDTEKGYLFINKILGILGFNYYSIFILEAILYVSSYCFLFRSDRRYLPFALPLIYMAQYSNVLNISRQFFATSVLLFAYRFLLEQKKILYLIIGGIACTIHNSAIIWIVLFFFFSKLDKFDLKLRYFVIITLASFFVNAFLKDLLYGSLSSLVDIVSLRGDIYGSGGILSEKFLREDKSFSQLLVQGVKYFSFYYIFYKQNKRGLFDGSIYLKNFVLIAVVSTPLVVLMGTHEIFSRMLYFASIFFDMGWGILLYNSIFFRKKCKLSLGDYMLILISVFHYFWSFYQMILSGLLNFETNLFIIYE